MSFLAILYIACRNHVSNVLSFSDSNSYIWLHKAFINDTDVTEYIISNYGKISCIFQGVTVQIINWDCTTIKSKTILLHFYLYNDCVQCSGCCMWSKIIQYCQWQNPRWCIQIACFVQAALLNPELESQHVWQFWLENWPKHMIN